MLIKMKQKPSKVTILGASHNGSNLTDAFHYLSQIESGYLLSFLHNVSIHSMTDTIYRHWSICTISNAPKLRVPKGHLLYILSE